MASRPIISLFQKTTHPSQSAGAPRPFENLDEVFAALESLAPKREPTRAEWLVTLAARSRGDREAM